MSRSSLIDKFIKFFEKKGHKVIPSSSLIPQNDSTVLFTTAGMHPLVPYLSGESHPQGKWLCNVQPCVRTDDIDEVGDNYHHTFFEMLGNWSLGDYWKKEAIEWSYEFLTQELGLEKEKLAISCFAGDSDASRDNDSAGIWKSLGILKERIAFLPKKDNWWGPAGQTGPCGPDTEMFIWLGESNVPKDFNPEDKRWVEVWNDVFMQYEKTADGKFEPLRQKNVDTGMGLERVLAVLSGTDDDYKTELFWPIIQKIEGISGKKYEDSKIEFRIIADHVKAAVFILAEGITPSNKLHGYILRRLIRRAVVKARNLQIDKNFLTQIGSEIFSIYPDQKFDEEKILGGLEKEEEKFRKTLDSAMLKLKIMSGMQTGSREKFGQIKWEDYKAVADDLFDLFQSDGLPLEVAMEELKKMKIPIVEKAFEQAKIMKNIVEQFDKKKIEHQEKSRTASAGMFKGGLADNKIETTRLHTAAHLLLAALREVLGEQVEQKGSNITEERLRFDFNNPEKLTPEQIEQVENIVNEKISEGLDVVMQEMNLDEAKKSGATGSFSDRYGEVVKIYTIGSDPSTRATRSGSTEKVFSVEICGGPHVQNTLELGHFKITKEESSSSDIRRIKAVLE